MEKWNMRILPDSHLTEAVDIIRGGGIVAHATETCYGFACDLTNAAAVERLFALKKRPRTMPVSALFATVEEAKKWVKWNGVADKLARKYLPGHLTVVLPLGKETLWPCPTKKRGTSGGKGKNSHILVYGNTEGQSSSCGTVGMRVSSHPVARVLAELAGVPLSTTSANLHGQPEPYSAREIVRQFSGEALQPDLILDSGKLPHAKPSTVVVIRRGKARVVRQGQVVLE